MRQKLLQIVNDDRYADGAYLQAAAVSPETCLCSECGFLLAVADDFEVELDAVGSADSVEDHARTAVLPVRGGSLVVIRCDVLDWIRPSLVDHDLYVGRAVWAGGTRMVNHVVLAVRYAVSEVAEIYFPAKWANPTTCTTCSRVYTNGSFFGASPCITALPKDYSIATMGSGFILASAFALTTPIPKGVKVLRRDYRPDLASKYGVGSVNSAW